MLHAVAFFIILLR